MKIRVSCLPAWLRAKMYHVGNSHIIAVSPTLARHWFEDKNGTVNEKALAEARA
jgi:hypothetical protein